MHNFRYHFIIISYKFDNNFIVHLLSDKMKLGITLLSHSVFFRVKSDFMMKLCEMKNGSSAICFVWLIYYCVFLFVEFLILRWQTACMINWLGLVSETKVADDATDQRRLSSFTNRDNSGHRCDAFRRTINDVN